MATILIIDDEPHNIKLLTMELEGTSHEILSACDGAEGWKTLEKEQKNIDLILLDRMMPNMNGMEFMAKIKEHEEFKHIPVIMQTAASEETQIAEGIRAGVYYYLTKPYEKEILISVINTALQEYKNQQLLQEEVKQHKKCFGLTTHSEWEFQTLDECSDMATFIASYFPDPERVVMGISELLINAVEHGNLGISYEEKGKLNLNGTWKEEINKRLKIPENNQKKVKVTYHKKDDVIELIIKDEGEGFKWSKYLEISPERATDSHGRGIALTKMMSFDDLKYNDRGNEVTCTTHLT